MVTYLRMNESMNTIEAVENVESLSLFRWASARTIEQRTLKRFLGACNSSCICDFFSPLTLNSLTADHFLLWLLYNQKLVIKRTKNKNPSYIAKLLHVVKETYRNVMKRNIENIDE